MEGDSTSCALQQDDLCYWMNSLAMAATRSLTSRFAPYGVTPHQFAILMMCNRGAADTVSGIARAMPIDPAAVSRNVQSLVQKGLLERQPLERDRRSAKLSVSEEGRDLLGELEEHVWANNAMLVRGIDTEERERFVNTIKRMLANTAAYETTRL